MNVPAKRKQHFKIGDRVRFRLGGRVVGGTVVEDLGDIGVRGQRLVRVEVPLDMSYVREFELPTELLSLASRRRVAA